MLIPLSQLIRIHTNTLTHTNNILFPILTLLTDEKSLTLSSVIGVCIEFIIITENPGKFIF